MFNKLSDEKQTNWDGGVGYGVSRNFASLEAKRKYKKGEHLLIKLEVSKSKWNKHIEATYNRLYQANTNVQLKSLEFKILHRFPLGIET